jgi:RNA polymerase sigma factor (sigma-70 family)
MRDDGDDDRVVYEEHAASLMRFATFLVGASDAADVVSAAVLGSLAAPSWPGVTNKRAFLFTAVLNEARMLHRGNSRRRAREVQLAVRPAVDPPEAHPEVRRAVDQLSPRQRAVILLTYWDDLAPSAIAELIGVSEGAVRRHLARGRAKLRSLLDDERSRSPYS